MDKKTYCPMPFITLTVNPGNYISRCMMSLDPMGPIKKETFSNGEYMILRNNMLKGVWDQTGCESCFYKESNNQSSQRQRWLEREEAYLGETGIYESNTSIKRNKIYHLYLNFNNICNFKCRMCGPHFSNAWIPDYKKLQEKTKVVKHAPIPPKQQVDVENFFKEFGDDLSELRQIWITGGEPFMDNSVYEFFEILKDYADLSKIKITINTNASKLNPQDLYKLKDLKQVMINVSVDSTGDLYEYMRGYNYNFQQLDTRMQEIKEVIKQQENLKLQVNGAYQIYNMLDLEKFWEWSTDILNGDSYKIEHRVLSGPRWLQARHAPKKIKKKARGQVNRLLKKYPDNMYLKQILKELKTPQDKKRLKDFCEWNSNLDNIRTQDLSDVFPELIAEITKDGYTYG
jgi:organic radical activating enzyme